MPDARLRVTDATGLRVVAIDKPLFTIGRKLGTDLHIGNTDVSREHAEIVRNGGQYLLRDRGSRYGTFVNGETVTERPLANGDRIRLGRSEAIELVFQKDERTGSGLYDSVADVGDLGRMAAILNGLRALGSGRVLDEVLTLVIDSALEVTRAERGFIMLAGAAGELEFKSGRERGGVTLTSLATTSEKIPREVFSTGKSLIVENLLESEVAPQHGQTIAWGIRSALCVPLRVVPMGQVGSNTAPEHVIGVLYLDGRRGSSLHSQSTQASLEAFGTQAALAIESARLYAEAAAKARLDRDLNVAASIQRALLPEPTYTGEVCDLAAIAVPCRTIGGDFYDYLELSQGRFAFALGDVAGKGPPAAILAATVQTNFAAVAPLSTDPATTMARVNVALLRRPVEARFATMFCGTIEDGGRLQYSNAGQEPPVIVRANGDIVPLEAGGPVLGLLREAAFEFDTVVLQPGDIVVVCSDGVTEARSAVGDEFGRDRLVAALGGTHGMKPDAVLDRLMAVIRGFVGVAPQADDITVLIVRYTGVRP